MIKIFLRLAFAILLTGILTQSSCKKHKPIIEDFSGTYILKRAGYSYWCDSYHKNGKDSFVYYGYYTYLSQPCERNQDFAEIKKLNETTYTICVDNRGNCSDTNFSSKFTVSSDSVDFAPKKFNTFADMFFVYRMRGVRTITGFRGVYTEYAIQQIPTSANPYDHIFIGTFELIKK